MTIKEAEKMVRDFQRKDIHTEDEVFMFTEAMEYLISERKRPEDMLYLGGYYYDNKRFDLALKYYEMAASYDYDPAYECLGYIWYYGRTGERDYKKAFIYFSKLMEKGDPVATYKVADMYKNGYYVDKDNAKYEEIIEKLYPRVKHMLDVFSPVPEVCMRLARIRENQGKKDEAIELYLNARRYLSQRISYNAFFGNLNMMKWLIDDLYELIEFDEDCMDFFDLYYLLKTPNKITFIADNEVQELESVPEGNECAVRFNDKWYRSRDDFFKEASVNGKRLTSIYNKLYGFEVK